MRRALLACTCLALLGCHSMAARPEDGALKSRWKAVTRGLTSAVTLGRSDAVIEQQAAKHDALRADRAARKARRTAAPKPPALLERLRAESDRLWNEALRAKAERDYERLRDQALRVDAQIDKLGAQNAASAPRIAEEERVRRARIAAAFRKLGRDLHDSVR